MQSVFAPTTIPTRSLAVVVLYTFLVFTVFLVHLLLIGKCRAQGMEFKKRNTLHECFEM